MPKSYTEITAEINRGIPAREAQPDAMAGQRDGQGCDEGWARCRSCTRSSSRSPSG